MGGEKDTAPKQGGKRGKQGKPHARRTSYVGMGVDEYVALSYTERIELGLDEDEVPEGPDRLTSEDMSRYGGSVIRSRQISQGQKKNLDNTPALIETWKRARDEVEPTTARVTLDKLVELIRGALDGFEEAKMLALAEPRFDTLSTLPFERPIDIALKKLGELETELDELAPVPKQVGPWEFRGARLPDGGRVAPPGDLASQTQQEGEDTLRLLDVARRIFAYLGSDLTKTTLGGRTLAFAMLHDPSRKLEHRSFLLLVYTRAFQGRDEEWAKLAVALADDDESLALAILERNAEPGDMAKLHRDYGIGLVEDLKRSLSSGNWARARTYLGAELPLQETLAAHDDEQVLRDLERLSDEQALALFAAPGTSPGTVGVPSTFEAVEAQIRAKLAKHRGSDRYYEAARIVLAKAQRGLAAERARQTRAGVLSNLFGVAAEPDRFPVGSDGLDPIGRARVDVAYQRVVLLSRSSVAVMPQMLAVAALDATERAALIARLEADHPGTFTALATFATSGDSETAILRTAILNEANEAARQGRPVDQVGLLPVLERVGDEVRAARAERDRIAAQRESPDYEATDASPAGVARQAEEDAPQHRLEELAATFLDDLDPVTARAMRGDSEQTHLRNLEAAGADPVRVSAAMLTYVPDRDTKKLIARIAQVDAKHRLEAMSRSGLLAKLESFPMTPDEQERVRAYLWEGRDRLDPKQLAPDPFSRQTTQHAAIIPAGFEPWPDSKDAPTPESILAVHDVVAGIKRGPDGAAEVLARLYHMDAETRTLVFADVRYRAAVDALGTGIADKDFRAALVDAEAGEVERALQEFPGPAGPWQTVELENIRVQAETFGRARLRRAFVLEQRGPAPALPATQGDAFAIERLRTIRSRYSSLDTEEQKAFADEILFGQPQLVDTAEAALNPNDEADYMNARLRATAGIAAGSRLRDWNHDNAPVIEAFTAFELLYTRARTGGVSRADLAQLAVLYYDAQDAYKQYKIDKAKNEASASSMAALVGTIVATVVVTVASGGLLGPVALGVLASVSAGTAAAVTGALIRDEDTYTSVLRDFGTGAVEGALAVAGEGLAARAVAKLTAGMPAGRAVAVAGEAATAKATSFGANVVKTAIDGAIGGAGGALFQSATDAATWDRGIARAFARMLVATLKGGAIGAGAGAGVGATLGGLGKLWKTFGAKKARSVQELLESANVRAAELDALGDAAREDLVRVLTHLEAGELAEAERLLARIEGLPAASRRALREVARGRVAIATARDLVGEDLKGIPLPIREVDDHLLPKLPSGQRATARFVIKDSQPMIFIRQGGSPHAVREEIVHHYQWARDPLMRARMENLTEEALADYKKFDLSTKRKRHLDALEVEADAQRRIIRQLEERAEDDADAALRVADADETLAIIEEKIAKLEAAKVPDDLHGLVDEAPQLFSSGAHTAKKVKGWHASRARGLIAPKNKPAPMLTDKVFRAKLRKLGYRVSESDDPTKLVRIVRDERYAHRLPHLRIKPDLTVEEVVSETRPSFAQRAAAAPKEWAELQQRMSTMQTRINLAQVTGKQAQEYAEAIARSGPQFRAALVERINKGLIDEAGAGLLAKWGGLVDKLLDDFAVESKAKTKMLEELFEDIPAKLSEADVTRFRRNLRDRIAKELVALPATKRVDKLYDMLAAFPESASLGHGFGAFRLEFLKTSKQTKGIYTPAGVKPPPFKGKDLDRSRQADDLITVTRGGDVPPGSYLGEDKAGPGAFDINQTVDIFKRWDDKLGGIVQNKGDKTKLYDGQIFFFARHSEAKSAYDAMRARITLKGEPDLKKIIDRDPPGIFTLYMDSKTGLMKRYPP